MRSTMAAWYRDTEQSQISSRRPPRFRASHLRVGITAAVGMAVSVYFGLEASAVIPGVFDGSPFLAKLFTEDPQAHFGTMSDSWLRSLIFGVAFLTAVRASMSANPGRVDATGIRAVGARVPVDNRYRHRDPGSCVQQVLLRLSGRNPGFAGTGRLLTDGNSEFDGQGTTRPTSSPTGATRRIGSSSASTHPYGLTHPRNRCNTLAWCTEAEGMRFRNFRSARARLQPPVTFSRDIFSLAAHPRDPRVLALQKAALGRRDAYCGRTSFVERYSCGHPLLSRGPDRPPMRIR